MTKQFEENRKTMIQLQTLLDKVNYQMLGETVESKTIYEELRESITKKLRRLNEEQKILAKESKENTKDNG